MLWFASSNLAEGSERTKRKKKEKRKKQILERNGMLRFEGSKLVELEARMRLYLDKPSLYKHIRVAQNV